MEERKKSIRVTMGKEEMTDDSPATMASTRLKEKKLQMTHISSAYTLVPQQYHSILAEFCIFQLSVPMKLRIQADLF